MAIVPLQSLTDFGTRSVLTHAIMALTFLGAVVSAVFIEGELGVISFVAFVNFTAGMWLCQSIHSLGHSIAGNEYDGVVSEVLNNGR